MFSAGAQGKPGGLAAYGGRIVFTLFEAFNIGMIGIGLTLL